VEEWLRRSWGHKELEIQGFGSTLQGGVAGALVKRTLGEKGVPAAFEMAKSFGGPDDLAGNLSRITGTTWCGVDKRHAVEIYEQVCRISDPGQREEIRESMLQHWKDSEVRHLMKSLPKLAPKDRIPAALKVLTHRPRKEIKWELANGGMRTSYERLELGAGELKDLHEGREEALRQTAIEAGVEIAELERQMVAQYFKERNDRALDLLERVERGPKMDEVIVEGIGKLSRNYQSNSEHEMTAFNGAMMISNAERRLGVARALFRRIYAKDPEAAKGMLEHDGFPEEVGAALSEISTQLGL
jgi:hypothetical protein